LRVGAVVDFGYSANRGTWTNPVAPTTRPSLGVDDATFVVIGVGARIIF
jgi:hypothetical protein